MDRFKGFFKTMLAQNINFNTQYIFIEKWASVNSTKSSNEIVQLEQRLVDIIKRSFISSKQEQLELLKQISKLQNIKDANDRIRSLASENQLIDSIIKNSQGDRNKIEQYRVQLYRKICTLCYAIKSLQTIYAQEIPIQVVEFIDSMNKCYNTELALQEYYIDKEIMDFFKPFSPNNPKYLKYCQEFLIKNQLYQYVNDMQYQMPQPQQIYQGISSLQNWQQKNLQPPAQQQSLNEHTQNLKNIIRGSQNNQKGQPSNIQPFNTQDEYIMINSITNDKQQEYCSNYGDQQDISKIIQQINKKNLRDPMKDNDNQQKYPEQSLFLQERQSFQGNLCLNNLLN